ncbi:hypothetical protein HMPREF1141_0598 [Clostridium sp. MSTE9]|jgi:hypothetical protein|nr:hypothetical protein HMPREF1141_0598 [Clostridium sp. MSTE9]DAT53895.1 MAG TPA: hypothetical protein [Caudoviricetes sp.]
MTWQQVAFKIGHHDEQYPRRKLDRFLKLYEMYGFKAVK